MGVFGFVKLRTVIGPKRRPNLGGSLWHTYFLKILLVCEEMSTGVVGKKESDFQDIIRNQGCYHV